MNINITEQLSVATYSNTMKKQETYPYHFHPLQQGKAAPSFSICRQQGVLGEEFSHSLRNEAVFTLQDFLDYGQPLAIFFPGIAFRTHLGAKKLEKLQQRIYEQGGKLLVVTPTTPKHIRRQLSGAHTLSVFHDNDNEIAEAFGLYNEQNPLWQWVSGIDEEAETLSAFYVVSPDKTIAYHFADFEFALYRSHDFSSLPFIEEMLNSVQQIPAYNHQTDLYQLVS